MSNNVDGECLTCREFDNPSTCEPVFDIIHNNKTIIIVNAILMNVKSAMSLYSYVDIY